MKKINLTKKSIERALIRLEPCEVDYKRTRFLDGLFCNKEWNRYVFEEFIKGPSDLAVSYRALVDGFGDLHYVCALVREIIEENLFDLDRQPTPLKVICDDNLMMVGSNPEEYQRISQVWRHHPNSPFFIPAITFTSNRAMGGKPILLQSKYTPQELTVEERALLVAEGFDEADPGFCDDEFRMMSDLGRAFRDNAPYVGIDFIRDQTGQLVFLEVNLFPDANPEFLGLSPKSEPKVCVEFLTSEIIAAHRQKFPPRPRSSAYIQHHLNQPGIDSWQGK